MAKKKFLYPIRKLHGRLNEKYECWKLHESFKKVFKDNPKSVFLLLTPEHGNIGDQGIALAETILLNNLGIQYIELTGRKLEQMKIRNQFSALNGFPILLNGGGYLGTIWMDSENIARSIILNNPDSPIMFLPNTIYYEDSDIGRREFQKSKIIYNGHKNLCLYAREQSSYNKMLRAYKNVKLIPDVVLSLDPYSFNIERKGCLLCLRSDREKTRTNDDDDHLISIINELFPDQYSFTDMIGQEYIPVNKRKAAVEGKLNEFCGAELVITDRLHGMIFCALSGTPCIVINSQSPKIKGCYEWIKDLEYIKFVDDIQSLPDVYRSIPKKVFRYNNEEFNSYFLELSRDIIEFINRTY